MKYAHKVPGKGTLAAILLLALVTIALTAAAVADPENWQSSPALTPTPAPVNTAGYPVSQASQAYPLPPIVNTTEIIIVGAFILVIALGATYNELRACRRRNSHLCQD